MDNEMIIIKKSAELNLITANLSLEDCEDFVRSVLNLSKKEPEEKEQECPKCLGTGKIPLYFLSNKTVRSEKCDKCDREEPEKEQQPNQFDHIFSDRERNRKFIAGDFAERHQDDD